MHDADLLRVAGDSRLIEDLTYDELTRIPLFPNGKSGDLKAEPLPGAGENPPLVVTRPQPRKAITSMCRCSLMFWTWWPVVRR